MSYREKQCPTCGTKHKKRGPYCSRSCGNRRKWTTDQKEVFSKKKTEYLYNTDKGEVERWQINQKDENAPVAPPDEIPLQGNQFVEGGDLWTTDDEY